MKVYCLHPIPVKILLETKVFLSIPAVALKVCFTYLTLLQEPEQIVKGVGVSSAIIAFTDSTQTAFVSYTTGY